LKGLTDFAKFFKIPCVGGKVSFYNETTKGPIKPTPVIGVLGIIENEPLRPEKIVGGNLLIIVGNTNDELGGSEYLEYIHGIIGGVCPQVDFKTSKKNMNAALESIKKGYVKCAHDCSKGGIAIAISELCMMNNIGCNISLENIPAKHLENDRILFSETHSRYLLVIEEKNLQKIKKVFTENNVSYCMIGNFGGNQIHFKKGSKSIMNLRIDKALSKWEKSLEELVIHG
jgi:phosphoribosylformylglycinamidine synthase